MTSCVDQLMEQLALAKKIRSRPNHVLVMRDLDREMRAPLEPTLEEKLNNALPDTFDLPETDLPDPQWPKNRIRVVSRRERMLNRFMYPVCLERAELLLRTMSPSQLSWMYMPHTSMKYGKHRSSLRSHEDMFNVFPVSLELPSRMRTFLVRAGTDDLVSDFYINLDYYAKISPYFAEIRKEVQEGKRTELFIEDERDNEIQVFFEVTAPFVKNHEDQRICFKNMLPLLRLSSKFSMRKLYDQCMDYLEEFQGWPLMSTDWIVDVIMMSLDQDRDCKVARESLNELLKVERLGDIEILAILEDDDGMIRFLQEILSRGANVHHNMKEAGKMTSCTTCKRTDVSSNEVCMDRFYNFMRYSVWAIEPVKKPNRSNKKNRNKTQKDLDVENNNSKKSNGK